MSSYVNTGGTAQWYKLRSASDRNCAACTAAGVINLINGHGSVTTGAVAKERGVADNVATMGGGTDEQAASIIAFVKNHSDRTWKKGGSGKKELPYSVALTFMESFPDHTVFAVCISGPVQGTRRCHWLNAIKAGGTIRYFDFQSNRELNLPGNKNPATSSNPILGIETQHTIRTTTQTTRSLHSSDQAGVFDVNQSSCIVIAFPPA
jgi:hypothetical protein